MTGPVAKPEQGSINFHLHTLASSLFKGATSYYVSRFGVGLPEMRILSNLGREGPLAAHRLVALTAMNKAIVSRVLATLARRMYISPTAPLVDPRRRIWQLTESGQELVDRLRPVWRQREAIIQSGLSAREQEQLVNMLKRLFEASEQLREQEAKALAASRTRAKSSTAAAPSKPASKPARNGASPANRA